MLHEFIFAMWREITPDLMQAHTNPNIFTVEKSNQETQKN